MAQHHKYNDESPTPFGRGAFAAQYVNYWEFWSTATGLDVAEKSRASLVDLAITCSTSTIKPPFQDLTTLQAAVYQPPYSTGLTR